MALAAMRSPIRDRRQGNVARVEYGRQTPGDLAKARLDLEEPYEVDARLRQLGYPQGSRERRSAALARSRM